MKNNKIHKLLEVLTEPGTEGKSEWRYDELAGKLGLPELEIKGYCDILAERPNLIGQMQSEGRFSRKYENCRKLFLTAYFKEDEPIPVPSKLPERFISGGSLIVAIVFGTLSHIRQNTIENQEAELVKKQKSIDSLSVQIEKLTQKIDSMERPPKPKKK